MLIRELTNLPSAAKQQQVMWLQISKSILYEFIPEWIWSLSPMTYFIFLIFMCFASVLYFTQFILVSCVSEHINASCVYPHWLSLMPVFFTKWNVWQIYLVCLLSCTWRWPLRIWSFMNVPKLDVWWVTHPPKAALIQLQHNTAR